MLTIFKWFTKPDSSHRNTCFSILRRISGLTWCEGSWPAATSPFLLELIPAVIHGSSHLTLSSERHHLQSIMHPLLASLWNFKCRRCRIRNMLDVATRVRMAVCWWQNNSIFDSLICPLLFFSDGQEQKESECRAFCPLHKVCQALGGKKKTWHPPPETIKRKSNISRVVMSHNLIYITKKKRLHSE